MAIKNNKSKAEGLRARKQRETRANIAKVGLSIFLAKGYDASTLEMIAAAANISRRTFFHYFESKEDVLTAWENEVAYATRAAFAEQPRHVGPLAVVRGALLSTIKRYESKEAVAIDRLMRSTESLRARNWVKYMLHEREVFAAALMERWPDPKDRLALRLIAMVGVGAFRLAVEDWSANDYRGSLARRFEKNLSIVTSQLRSNPGVAGD